MPENLIKKNLISEQFINRGLENSFNSLYLYQTTTFKYQFKFYDDNKTFFNEELWKKCLNLFFQTSAVYKCTNLELFELLSLYTYLQYSKKIQLKIINIITHLDFFLEDPSKKFDFSRLKYSISLENKNIHLINILIKYTFNFKNFNFFKNLLLEQKKLPFSFKHFYNYLFNVKFIFLQYPNLDLNKKININSITLIKLFFYYFVNSFHKDYLILNNITYDNLFIFYINNFLNWLHVYKNNQLILSKNSEKLINKKINMHFKKLNNYNQLKTPVSINNLLKQQKEKTKLLNNSIKYLTINQLKKKRFNWLHLTKNILWIPKEYKSLYFWYKRRFWINEITYSYAYNTYYNELYPLFLELKSKLFIENYFNKNKNLLSYHEFFQVEEMKQFKKNLFPTALWIRCSSITLIKYFISYYIESLPLKWIKKNKKFLQFLVSQGFFSIKTRYKKNIPPKVILATYMYNMSFSKKFAYIPGIYAIRRFLELDCQDIDSGQTYNLRILLYWLVTDDFIKKNISTCLNFLRLCYLARGKPLRLFRTIDKYFESYKGGISQTYAGYILRLVKYSLINLIFEDLIRFINRDNKNIFSKYTNFNKLGLKELYTENLINSRLNAFKVPFKKYPIKQIGLTQAAHKLKFRYHFK